MNMDFATVVVEDIAQAQVVVRKKFSKVSKKLLARKIGIRNIIRVFVVKVN